VEEKWSGTAVANLYAGPVLRALKRAYPGRATFTVLEDNDPTGFCSTKGLDAKAEAGIKIFNIPRRSPDLNVCDYALWRAIIRKMRAEEATWRKSRKETRDAFIARLHATAKALPKSFIQGAIGDMRRRCQRLFDAQGGLFEEGGLGASSDE
jgi:hypothetical protein